MTMDRLYHDYCTYLNVPQHLAALQNDPWSNALIHSSEPMQFEIKLIQDCIRNINAIQNRPVFLNQNSRLIINIFISNI